ncbi:hypothetical protein D7I43_32015 [Micromonospora globbae]|uniref:Uncharacterized protein n=1 Tax=Micromonospora globbae TaxID=1894969 RepID=A0A420EEQ1_9ACTN|nr:hypothetical protein D7I43_32015 [Micromonospora globbae]
MNPSDAQNARHGEAEQEILEAAWRRVQAAGVFSQVGGHQPHGHEQEDGPHNVVNIFPTERERA